MKKVSGKDIRLLPDSIPDAGLWWLITSEGTELITFPITGGVLPSIAVPVLKQLIADIPRMQAAIRRIKDLKEDPYSEKIVELVQITNTRPLNPSCRKFYDSDF